MHRPSSANKTQSHVPFKTPRIARPHRGPETQVHDNQDIRCVKKSARGTRSKPKRDQSSQSLTKPRPHYRHADTTYMAASQPKQQSLRPSHERHFSTLTAFKKETKTMSSPSPRSTFEAGMDFIFNHDADHSQRLIDTYREVDDRISRCVLRESQSLFKRLNTDRRSIKPFSRTIRILCEYSDTPSNFVTASNKQVYLSIIRDIQSNPGMLKT